MGRLLLGLVLAGSLLAVAGPQQSVARGQTAAIVTAAASEAATDRCGKRPRKPNGKLWRCSFVDNFVGRDLNRDKWLVARDRKPPPKSGAVCRRGANVKLARGQLRLTTRRTGHAFGCRYTAASVSTYHLFSQKYGRFEAKIKAEATKKKGLQESFWLWPDDRIESKVKWPAAGEIDIAETYSQFPNLAVPFLHYTHNDNGGPVRGLNTAWDCKARRGRWHRYTLLWGPRRIEILVDGKRCLVNTSGDEAFKKKYIVALTANVGVGGNLVNGQTKLPATMKVAYVRVWR